MATLLMQILDTIFMLIIVFYSYKQKFIWHALYHSMSIIHSHFGYPHNIINITLVYHLAGKFGGKTLWKIYHGIILVREKFGKFVIS